MNQPTTVTKQGELSEQDEVESSTHMDLPPLAFMEDDGPSDIIPPFITTTHAREIPPFITTAGG